MRRTELRAKKKAEAEARQAAHDALTTQQKLDKLKNRFASPDCPDGLAAREYNRLMAQLAKEEEANAPATPQRGPELSEDQG